MKQEITINNVKGIWIPIDEIHSLKELDVPAGEKTKLQEAREKYKIGDKVKCLTDGALGLILDSVERDIEDTNGVWLSCYYGKYINSICVYQNGIWAEILPNYPTMDEIWDSVKPKYFMNDSGIVDKIVGEGIENYCLPTQEDAEFVAAVIQLINIASYYNAMFPDEEKTDSFYFLDGEYKYEYTKKGYFIGDIKFTPSAAAAAIKNPNVVEVLQKYFRISK